MLPPVELYTNTNQLPTVACPGNHPVSPRSVKACFPPAFCWAHSRNQAPKAGWAYITAEEAAMLSILRRFGWFQDAYEELLAREVEQQMNGVSIETDGSETDDAEETKDAESTEV
ncbi:hypothetical protein PHYPSEUDO_000649 [Phytophthora pseudosyringae]|uniref:Uncharacterized protein n=1 Tax=Phytophthora pseudosyringae TaxID=221518 RepID=A0A8T1V5C4_9STRA|nr:hypothetical protein PHYPSEUDO_000649 [Phytophthora pseudosyringae]